MTYEEVVLKVREGFEYADARSIFEHVAVQVNIEGEGSGAFYIEVADRKICVEPYDYVDRDGLFMVDARTMIAISEGELAMEDAIKSGALRVQGNMTKIAMLTKIKIKNKAAAETSKGAEGNAVSKVTKTVTDIAAAVLSKISGK